MKAAPRTSAAPFRAVPTPEPLPLGDEPGAASGNLDRPNRMSGPGPRVPRQTTAGGADSSAFGDWAPQSRSGDMAPGLAPALPGDLLTRDAPPTTAIPERPISRRDRSADVLDDRLDDHLDDVTPPAVSGRPAATRGPGTGPVGGRAAMRAERQAADMARRKAAKRSGAPAVVLDPDDEPRKPRRVLKGLVAMAVVGLGVLGVYTVVSPPTEEAATQAPFVATTAPTAPVVEPLPTLPSEPIAVEPTPAAPIRVPVTVLNATDINGLAGKISQTVVGGGWESPAVGAYLGDDVPVTTVFFTEGDENQRQAALQLIEMYPQITGPAPRFFELPPDVPAPGLVVVAAGEWVP